jgi:hypothetical protein
MEGYRPEMSFDERVAREYRDIRRGDEAGHFDGRLQRARRLATTTRKAAE